MPVPLLVGAMAASAAAGIASSIIGANASKDAAAAAAAQEQKALDFQKQTWATTQQNEQPYLEAGKQGLANYQTQANAATQPTYNYKIPDFNFSTYEDPSAQYRMAQAAKAINNSSIAKGLTGGGAIKALASKSQEMAGGAYADAWKRYLENTQQQYKQAGDIYNRNLDWQNTQLGRQQDLAKIGGTMASGLGTLGAETGKNIGSTYEQLAGSQVGGIAGAGNAVNQGITGVTNNLSKGLGYINGLQTNNLLSSGDTDSSSAMNNLLTTGYSGDQNSLLKYNGSYNPGDYE